MNKKSKVNAKKTHTKLTLHSSENGFKIKQEVAIQLQWAANNLQLTLNVLGPLNLSFAITVERMLHDKKKYTKWIKCASAWMWKCIRIQ